MKYKIRASTILLITAEVILSLISFINGLVPFGDSVEPDWKSITYRIVTFFIWGSVTFILERRSSIKRIPLLMLFPIGVASAQWIGLAYLVLIPLRKVLNGDIYLYPAMTFVFGVTLFLFLIGCMIVRVTKNGSRPLKKERENERTKRTKNRI